MLRTNPALGAYSITPNDSADNVGGKPVRAISVLVTGDVKITTPMGEDVTINVAAGAPYPISAKRIWSTGTTATGIVVLY